MRETPRTLHRAPFGARVGEFRKDAESNVEYETPKLG